MKTHKGTSMDPMTRLFLHHHLPLNNLIYSLTLLYGISFCVSHTLMSPETKWESEQRTVTHSAVLSGQFRILLNRLLMDYYNSLLAE